MCTKLTPIAIEQQLIILNQNAPLNWRIEDSKLVSIAIFKDFITAFAFITKIALIAERMQHHPELYNVYNRVSIHLTTHDIDGISDLDFQLAQEINSIAA